MGGTHSEVRSAVRYLRGACACRAHPGESNRVELEAQVLALEVRATEPRRRPSGVTLGSFLSLVELQQRSSLVDGYPLASGILQLDADDRTRPVWCSYYYPEDEDGLIYFDLDKLAVR
eukprot:5730636-Prymnesium_polylepis.1